MVTIYGFAMSPYVSRVILGCRVGGVEYDLLPPPEGFKSEAHLALNPFGKIPILVDNDVVLHESLAILDYLDRAHEILGNAAKSAAAAALDTQNALIVENHIQVHIGTLFRQWVSGEKNQEVVKDAAALLASTVDILEATENFAQSGTSTIGKAELCAAPAFVFLDQLMGRYGIDNPIGKTTKIAKYANALRSHDRLTEHLNVVDSMLVKRLDG